MSDGLTIALDAMGGDKAPDMVVQGADIALERYPELKIILVGDEARIRPLVEKTKRLKAQSPEIVHTEKAIADEDKPSVALRQGKGSSMRLAIDLVGQGRADGVVSAGNTGALMAIAKLVLRPMPGIDRPAIAGFFPTRRGESAMLDLGANITCDATNLVQFAIMGQIFVRTVLGLERPVVGILNVGIEEQKGNDSVREAATILRGMTDMPFEFHGFVEGDDIPAGTVDVVVTDGFSGNIALKTAEGTSRLIGQFLRDAFRNSLMSKLGYLLARGAVGQLRQRMDPRRYNGAMFLGLNGIAVKSHGGTDALGFANAIGVAADMKRYGFIEKVREELTNGRLDRPDEQPTAVATA
ncbi:MULTISPECIES: phosphate acyltransferase PlsX [Thalassobaculum]|uniref:Phosphate acyltransferase n=1 Tax=Thalassobaculum litoreum DSM 18839 TaxID=1123362 RepID=A0A8G2BE54_9PROT|nr:MULTISPECIES: phosphate acyltransferase PlsX [Thalassobaculum]SDF10749.1 phosphate:acyl-[acyl carrier protein] acyltransferase [Thalassobaculum litoreum DSM 18839]